MIGVVLFTTTKGHFGRKDLYKWPAQQWLRLPVTQHYAHIKVTPGEEDIAEEMEDWLECRGFCVEKTLGKWSHNSNSHAEEYTRDIIKAFSSDFVHGCEYSVFLEDDYVLQGEVNESLEEARRCLVDEKDVLAVRWNNTDEQLPKLGVGYNDRCPYLCRQLSGYTKWGPTFTFQPSLVRTRDMYHAYRLIRDNWSAIKKQHIELTSGLALKQLSDSETPFYFVRPSFSSAVHIGEKPFEKRL